VVRDHARDKIPLGVSGEGEVISRCLHSFVIMIPRILPDFRGLAASVRKKSPA
jgi:hypothetical protein